jgi:uncharacterized membrane protein YfcA
MSGDISVTQVLIVIAAAALAGLVRGFSGFGPAMVFTPIASAVFGPVVAVPVLFVMDAVISIPVLVRAVRACHWPEVLPISIAAAATVPLGIRALVALDPDILRWILSVAILLAVAAIGSGWRYRRRPGLPATLAAGALSGLGGGFAGLYGPPIILFWLGGQSEAATVRANLFAYFGLVTVVAGVSFWISGLFAGEVLRLSILLMPAYGLALWAGTHLFRRARESLYRRLALTLCTLAALAGLPLWS